MKLLLVSVIIWEVAATHPKPATILLMMASDRITFFASCRKNPTASFLINE